jgi:hypothetical protein
MALQPRALEVFNNAIVPCAKTLTISHPVCYRCNLSQDVVSRGDGVAFLPQRSFDHVIMQAETGRRLSGPKLTWRRSLQRPRYGSLPGQLLPYPC